MASRFVHLHTHSEYSLLDGANRTGDLIRRAKELEMPALALTDHGVMHGCFDFYKKAKAAGIRPILGMEAYVAPGDRRDRKARTPAGRNYYHLVLLARDLEGYKNLCRLSSIGFIDGFYSRPRLDREVLAAHSEGIVVTSACLAGEVAQAFELGRPELAREAAEWYANTFKDRFYLEVQGHGSEGQAALNDHIFRLSADLGLPVVATNDVHFLTHEDHGAHDVLMCIGLGKDHADPDRMRYDQELYFKSATEMEERFRDRPDVLENTVRIGEETDLVFQKKYHVPAFPLPEDVATEDDLLRKLSYEGADVAYGTPLPEPVRERLEYELDVITRLGYSGYFLILQDVIAWALDNGIPVGPGRGSAAGSIVAYATGITQACPLKHDLLFERFLNPDRATMPDIDVDFSQEGRQAIIQYTRERYGDEAVCQIATFGTMKARAVIKDVGRVMGFSPGQMNVIASKIPNAPNNSLTVAEAVEKVDEIRKLAESMATRERELVDYSVRLEGLARHASIHAGGVVIAPGPVHEYVPIFTQARGKGEALRVTQYDMNAVEEAGLLKMDFLGLKTLDAIAYARDMIRERHGVMVAFDTREQLRFETLYGPSGVRVELVDLEAEEAYALLRSGRTGAVFQMESSLATDKLRAMGADRFEDIVATSALIRPGPLDTGMTDTFIRRKRGVEAVDYPHADLVPALEPTYGVIVYQEQVMRTAQILAGYTLAEADILRKAVGKKDAELIRKELGKFRDRAVERGYERTMVEKLAADIEAFGRYGFNRSHSVAYGLLTFQTSYLKARYPAEFLAAHMTFEKTEKVPRYIAEARDAGIRVLPPSVNDGAVRFNVVEGPDRTGAIRVGLGGVKGIGEEICIAIVRERESGGRYEDFFDFVSRLYRRGLNSKGLESLVNAGALDDFGRRSQLLHGTDLALAHAKLEKKEHDSGQHSLFDMFGAGDSEAGSPKPQLPDVAELDLGTRLGNEKEVLEFYVSGHPMEEHEEDSRLVRTGRIAELEPAPRRSVTVVGVVTLAESKVARSGNRYGKAVIEDTTGAQRLHVFGKQWERLEHKFVVGDMLAVEGHYGDELDPDEDAPELIVDQADPLVVAVASARNALGLAPVGRTPRALNIRLARALGRGDPLATRLQEIFAAHQGSVPVRFAFGPDAGFREARARVDPSPQLLGALGEVIQDAEVSIEWEARPDDAGPMPRAAPRSRPRGRRDESTEPLL
jgi:DNA polymerase III subunit alpha